jgi:hypothetical protein
MARKRFVTSDMSIDEKIADIAVENPVAALMWPWFITGFDDWGRMEAAPVKIKLSIFPAFPYTPKDIEEAIDLYAKYGIVHKYEVCGKEYLAIDPEKYYKYQTYIRGNKREVDGSNCPAPPNPPWGSAGNSEDSLATNNQHALARTCTQVSADERKCIPSPSPSPSPSENISTSEHSPDTMPDQPDKKMKEPEKPKKTRQIPLFDKNTEQYKIAMFIRDCVLANLPKAKVPDPTPEGLRRWAYDIDLMMRIDCRSPDEIRQLMDWAHRDSFWKANILSPGKLREKWDTLVAHRQRGEERIKGAPKYHAPQAANFEQRKYTKEHFEKLYKDV